MWSDCPPHVGGIECPFERFLFLTLTPSFLYSCGGGGFLTFLFLGALTLIWGWVFLNIFMLWLNFKSCLVVCFILVDCLFDFPGWLLFATDVKLYGWVLYTKFGGPNWAFARLIFAGFICTQGSKSDSLYWTACSKAVCWYGTLVNLADS